MCNCGLYVGILMELKARNCCSVCFINDLQFVLLWFDWYGVGVRHVHVVFMIGRWSEGSVWTVCHVVFCSNVGEQKVMSREDV